MSDIRVAVAGQPNCGKSTMFNSITGATARVGNYPGITVDRLEGRYKLDGHTFFLVDLPGAYSLTAYSMEEVVARNVIVDERPDACLCILDATALDRSLYLVVQIMEMQIPIVLGLNMMDEAKRKGVRINSAKLSELLGVPVVECIARVGQGREELMTQLAAIVGGDGVQAARPLDISYGQDLDPVIKEMTGIIEQEAPTENRPPARWLSIKLLEGDEDILKRIRAWGPLAEKLERMASDTDKHMEAVTDSYAEAVIADHRYGFINGLVNQDVLTRESDLRFDLSDKMDRILTHRLLGPLIMMAVLWSMFYVTFTLGAAPQGWVEDLFGWMAGLGIRYIPEGLVQSLVVSGVLDGVGAVMSFTPLILIMFVMLVFLEDLGYMARVAYMVDRVFRMFGLHGMSVMPLVMAGGMPGGCAVPGVMCARTLRSPRERLATILTSPFMVCGAKTTAYIMLTAAFFPKNATVAMFLVVLASWFFVLVVSRILRWTVVKGPHTPFVMELPPYRLPTVRGVAIHAWERVWQYMKKAGTVILAISVIMWALMTFPRLDQVQVAGFDKLREQAAETARMEATGKPEAEARQLVAAAKAQVDEQQGEAALQNSYAGRVSSAIEPVTDLAGFPWQANISFVGAFAAKEVFVSTMATAYSMGDVDPDAAANLSDRIRADKAWTGPVIASVFLFLLLYTPCMVTVVAIAKDSNWKWAAFSVASSLCLAFIVSVAAYQIGSVFW
ncbi:MAG: ferrous iron transport protein B [Desulfovibrionaceae bacterium]